jgi:tetratricopeptide (TPR) repeat protein
VNGQIGVIHYLNREFKKAFPYLQQSFVKHWVARAMLAVSYMKRKNTDKMVDTFEAVVRMNKKEGILWSLYAYCLLEVGNKDKAMEILSRGVKKASSDDRLKQNQILLQNNKRLKMTGYGELWYQFHLGKPPKHVVKQPRYYHRYR